MPSKTKGNKTMKTAAPVPSSLLTRELDGMPDFKVKDHLGNEWTLAKLKGKNAVIWFYPKADTPG